MTLNDEVRAFWEQQPCGTSPRLVGEVMPGTPEWFAQIEEYRYRTEPFIHAFAQFSCHSGKAVLEIGVGAGTDHLQWARAGCQCYGVDLTDAAIETTRAHLALYGLRSNLQRIDAEVLPFQSDAFDVVYSWGVIHHSEHPERIIAEIHRVLKPRGVFIGMMYGRRSPHTFKVWVRHALLTGRPWETFSHVLWHHMESVGTKAYTVRELRHLFAAFSGFTARPIITPHDTRSWPCWLSQFFPDRWGWFIGLHASK